MATEVAGMARSYARRIKKLYRNLLRNLKNEERRMKKTSLFLLLVPFLLPLSAAAAEDTPAAQEEMVTVFIVSEYRYEPGETGGDPDIGQSLCGTRCNALSVDYLNYVMPGGWRMIKISGNQEIVVDLNNPFMGGKCICVVDEYRVKVHDLYMSK
ncbi:MAG: hypothetical protein C4519_24565 [Desulfobacteraceae bacterium]|nr:MAG: hypothetical protein C4519_24565 [Desulfobacteraceae bacterium]